MHGHPEHEKHGRDGGAKGQDKHVQIPHLFDDDTTEPAKKSRKKRHDRRAYGIVGGLEFRFTGAQEIDDQHGIAQTGGHLFIAVHRGDEGQPRGRLRRRKVPGQPDVSPDIEIHENGQGPDRFF